LEKIGFISGKGKEEMGESFWGSKKEVLTLTIAQRIPDRNIQIL